MLIASNFSNLAIELMGELNNDGEADPSSEGTVLDMVSVFDVEPKNDAVREAPGWDSEVIDSKVELITSEDNNKPCWLVDA